MVLVNTMNYFLHLLQIFLHFFVQHDYHKKEELPDNWKPLFFHAAASLRVLTLSYFF